MVVLSSNDGARIARSNEVKDLGVAMARPWFRSGTLGGVPFIALSANFNDCYMSSRMMSVVGALCTSPGGGSNSTSSLRLRRRSGRVGGRRQGTARRVLRETGLPTSVGFGPTKTLAKLANDAAKTADRKPGTYPAFAPGLVSTGWRLRCMSKPNWIGGPPTPKSAPVWGVGKKISCLTEGGICTVLDLVRSDTVTLRRQFSVVLEKTVLELRGTSCVDLNDVPGAQQQILGCAVWDSVTQQAGIVEAVSEFGIPRCRS